MTAAVVCESSQISPALTLRMLLTIKSGEVCFRHDSRAAQFHGLHELVLVFGCRQNDDFGAQIRVLQGLHNRKSVHVGHAQIEQQNVRILLLNQLENFPPIARLADDFKIVFQAQ